MPLIILLTTLGNAILNAMLAPLLGLNLGLRQSFLAILMSFAIASAILGAFSPLAAFMIWNLPPLVPGAQASDVNVPETERLVDGRIQREDLHRVGVVVLVEEQ